MKILQKVQIYMLKDSIPSQILESTVTETDQATISNARWKEGRKERQLAIFSSFTTLLLLLVLC